MRENGGLHRGDDREPMRVVGGELRGPAEGFDWGGAGGERRGEGGYRE